MMIAVHAPPSSTVVNIFRPGRFAPLLAALFLATIVALLFGQREQSVFILDDLFIVEDPHMRVAALTGDAIALLLHGLSAEAANRPLPAISFMLDWWRGNGDPAVFYQTNVLLHGINAVLVFFLSTKILSCRGAARAASVPLTAFFAAALWAVHPIHLNAVAYISQRMTEMAAMGVLAGLILYLSARTARDARARIALFGASHACWLMACVSKENAWIAPAYLVLIEIGVMRNGAPSMFLHALEKKALAILLLGAAALAGSLLLEGSPATEWLNHGYLGYAGWDFTLPQRLLTQPRVVFFYLTQLAWPVPGRFAIEHDIAVSEGLFDPAVTALALGALAVWLGAALIMLAGQGKRLYGALLLFPLMALSVESSIIPLDMIFEHRMYLPSVTLFILAASGLALLPRRLFLPCASMLVLLLAWSSTAYLKHWNSKLDIYASAAPHAATSIRLQYNYANALSDAGRDAEAVSHYRQALSVRSPSVNRLNVIAFASIHFNEALSLVSLGRLGEAKQALESAIRLAPDHAKAHAILADLYAREGNRMQARWHLEQVLGQDPFDRRARALLQQLTGAP